MTKLPLIAVRRLRSGSGSVVLPGCPIPGSSEWSDDVRAKRIKTGFAQEQPQKIKSSAKKSRKKSEAQPKKDK